MYRKCILFVGIEYSLKGGFSVWKPIHIRQRSMESVLGTSEHGLPVFRFLLAQARLMFEGTLFHDYSNMRLLLHMLHILYAIMYGSSD
jgi:hypothetical protein